MKKTKEFSDISSEDLGSPQNISINGDDLVMKE